MSVKKINGTLVRLVLAVIVLFLAPFLQKVIPFQYTENVIYFIAWLLAGINLIVDLSLPESRKSNIVMVLLTLVLLITNAFQTGACAIVLYSFGQVVQAFILSKSRSTLGQAADIRPKFANVDINGKLEQVAPSNVAVGDIIVVKSGEVIPLDGVIVAGQSAVDMSFLNGDKIIHEVDVKEKVYSGCINTKGLLKIQVDTMYSECAVNKLINIIEGVNQSSSQISQTVAKFSNIYMYVVLALALLLAIVPIVKTFIYVMGASGLSGGVKYVLPAVYSNVIGYIHQAVRVMMVSSPCVFLLSIPVVFYTSIRNATKYGIFVKGDRVLETLSKVNTAVFDKVATLTKGRYKVDKVVPSVDVTKEELAQMVYRAVASSNDAMFTAIKEEFKVYQKKTDEFSRPNVTLIEGKGLWMLDGKTEILIGNKDLMGEYDIPVFYSKLSATNIYVAKDKRYVGSIVLVDRVMQGAKTLVLKLKSIGVKSVMLSTEIKENVSTVSKIAGIEQVYGGLMNQEKVSLINTFRKEAKLGKKVMYAGGNIDDVDIFASADVGIASGSKGNEPSVSSAGVIIPDDNLAKIYIAVDTAKKTILKININILAALIIKILVLFFAITGKILIWQIIAVDIILSLILILNGVKIVNKKS